MLHSFTGGADGASPLGGLTLSGSTLYGSTEAGGANGEGNVFSINTDGTGYSVLYSFDRDRRSIGDLVLSGSMLYGVTQTRGAYNNGVVFGVSTSAPAPVITAFQASRPSDLRLKPA